MADERQSQGKARTTMISVRIPVEVEEGLKEEAQRSGESFSELIRSRLSAKLRAERNAADVSLFKSSSTTSSSDVAFEAVAGQLVPKTRTSRVVFLGQ